MTDQAKINERFEELAKIKNGWHNGRGRAVPQDVLERARRFVAGVLGCGLPMPCIFPVVDPEGGVEIEWFKDQYCFSVEFFPGGKGELMMVDCDNTLASDIHFEMKEIKE